MAIVYGIIRQHKGFITITSRPGEGTTFHVYLPLVVPEAEAPFQEEIRQELPKGKGETILLAEDDDAVRNVMEIFLKLAGYNVLVAVDGAEAVEQFAARNGEIALVVMDMIMPKKSGKEAFTEIKRRWPDARVLYTSGYPRKVIQEQGHLDGGESFIVKPVHAAELLGKVRTILDTPSGAHAA
jgi:CheY-like chemotaxis protein